MFSLTQKEFVLLLVVLAELPINKGEAVILFLGLLVTLWKYYF